MNTLKQIATKAMVFVFALSVLVPAVMTVGDNNVVEAEKLATVYLTNKGTAKTTEPSPPTARANPSSRSTVSTLYATMTDVDTANATQNSHIVNANKIVITVVEPDFNTKVAVVSGENNFAAAAVDANDTVVIQGSAGNPVIDTDSDGDLTDEVYFAQYPDATDTTAVTFSGNSLDNGANKTGLVVQAVSVANGASATTTAKPMITGIILSLIHI